MQWVGGAGLKVVREIPGAGGFVLGVDEEGADAGDVRCLDGAQEDFNRGQGTGGHARS